MKKYKKTPLGLLTIMVFASLVFVLKVKADIPGVPSNTVLCTCVSSTSQTCASKTGSFGGSFTTKSACDSSNNYSVYDFNYPNTSVEGNPYTATGTVLTFNSFTTSSVYLTLPSYTPASPHSLGENTGQPCMRSGGNTGTLWVTGVGIAYNSSINSNGGVQSGGGGPSGAVIQFSCYNSSDLTQVSTVQCTCVTNSSQTCLTEDKRLQWGGGTGYNHKKNSCDQLGVYKTETLVNFTACPYPNCTQQLVGNISAAQGNLVNLSPLPHEYTVGGLAGSNIGYNSGVPCTRSGGVNGTLRVTGYKTGNSNNGMMGTMWYASFQYSCY